MGDLLVSPFYMKWRCYAQAGGVEESTFCLFSVVFPVRCISSISPRFYFRRHTFCFLPLATILEFYQTHFKRALLVHPVFEACYLYFMTTAPYFGETSLFWGILLCLSLSFFLCLSKYFKYVFVSPLSKTKLLLSFFHLHLHPQGHFCHFIFPYICPLIFLPSAEVTLTSVRKRGIDLRGPRTVSQGLFWSVKWSMVPEGGFQHVWLCLHHHLELMVSNLEKTNLTSRMKLYG
jgi:hypothetical protein